MAQGKQRNKPALFLPSIERSDFINPRSQLKRIKDICKHVQANASDWESDAGLIA